jgi:hypothetical protein
MWFMEYRLYSYRTIFGRSALSNTWKRGTSCHDGTCSWKDSSTSYRTCRVSWTSGFFFFEQENFFIRLTFDQKFECTNVFLKRKATLARIKYPRRSKASSTFEAITSMCCCFAPLFFESIISISNSTHSFFLLFFL